MIEKMLPKKMMSKSILMICGLVLLAACGKEKAVPALQPTLPSATQRIAAVPASTSFFIQQTLQAQPTLEGTEVANLLDPGPYFTPQRPAPTDSPVEFAPPEKVGVFNRTQVRGGCAHKGGQSSEYRSQDNAIIYLTCQYAKTADDAKNYVEVLPQVFQTEPIQMKIQPDKSFVLLRTGEDFLYGWTQGAWYFTARSLDGRQILDAFMQYFPY